MKKILFAASLLFTLGSASAQYSEKFMSAMKRNMAMIDSSFRNPMDLLNLSNSFERIAQAEKTQWLPYYYAALCQVNYAYLEQDKSKVDGIADKAEALALAADSLQPANSEISCIRSMIASARLMVNPMQRYMQYGAESEKHLKLAMAQDTSNPRPYFLKATSLKFTPVQFGGGCKTALPVFQTALEKFGSFKPADELQPSWGKTPTEQAIAECTKP